MEENSRQDFLNTLGKLIAFFTVVLYVALIINDSFTYIPENVLNVFNIIKQYASITLLGIVGFESVARRTLPFRIIFFILFAIVVLAQFFPALFADIMGLFIPAK